MKKFIVFTLLLAVTGIFTQSCKTESQFKTGMSVAAKWTDGNYYLATIKTITGETYAVDYADGSNGEVKVTDLKLITEKSDLKAGDKVQAVWAGAKFYPGKIKELKEKGAIIIWDDGTTESEVVFGKIMKM
ncbi:MAG: DUF4537 domain-containing protein [Bacteroidia bacterium]|nr:DUF4537 domain-containing protein [Bacteroidia bacterium]